MPQKTSPYVESKYGWDFGESGWNVGADENFIKFGFLHDSNIDGIVNSLPAAVNGKAYYLTADKRVYFVANSTYYSTSVPLWFRFTIRSTGAVWYFDGNNLVEQAVVPQLTASEIKNLYESNPDTNAFTDQDLQDIEELQDFQQTQSQTNKSIEKTVLDYGAVADGVTNDSAAVAAMLAETNSIVCPAGKVVVFKNIQLNTGSKVDIRGTARLPNGCVDADRLLYADNKAHLDINIKDIDGNYANQSGPIGTHLIYLTNCQFPIVNVSYIRDHYISSGAVLSDTLPGRNESTGTVWLYRCLDPQVNIRLVEGWSREGIYLEECTGGTLVVGHMEGKYSTEYSGTQCKGRNIKHTRASVNNAGASGVGFDVIDGVLSNIISTNTRENHGINFGHTGFPADRTVANNLVIDGAFIYGINVGANSADVSINGFSIQNAGQAGVNVSDGAVRPRLANGSAQDSGTANLQVSITQVPINAVKHDVLVNRSLEVNVSSGKFVSGEGITQGAATGVVKKAISNLTGTKQVLFLSSSTGTFNTSANITGGTSGAVGTATRVSIPVQRLEASGGVFQDNWVSNLSVNGATINKLQDGTCIYRKIIAVSVGTANIITSVTENFPTEAGFISAPACSVNIVAPSSTTTYTVSKKEVTRSSTSATIELAASVVQTYSCELLAIGRWK